MKRFRGADKFGGPWLDGGEEIGGAAAGDLLLEAGESATPPLVPVERGRDLPLSFGQERIWFLDRLESGSVAYNIPIVFHLLGSGLDPGLLEAALAEVVRRHEALRTVYWESAGGTPVQLIRTAIPSLLPVLDLSGLPDAAAEAARVEERLARLPFDLAQGPLFRAALPRAVPIMAAGNIWTREDAEQTLARGADLIALGRAAVLNPDWPRDAVDPTWQPRRPPMAPDELIARAVSPTFVEYLRRWKGFVA